MSKQKSKAQSQERFKPALLAERSPHRLDRTTLWSLTDFFNAAGRILFTEEWDFREMEHRPPGVSDVLSKARNARSAHLTREIVEAMQQGVVHLVVDLKRLAINPDLTVSFEPKEIDVRTDVGKAELFMTTWGLTAKMLAWQRLTFLTTDPLGFVNYYPIATADDLLKWVDWENSGVCIDRSAVLAGFTSMESLLAKEVTHTYDQEVYGVACTLEVDGVIPEIIELSAYVNDAASALPFFERRAKAQAAGRKQYKSHDWGLIFAVMWRHVALRRLHSKNGAQAQLVALCEESVLDPPGTSDLYLAANRVLKQFDSGNDHEEVMHKSRLRKRDDIPVR